MMQFLLPSALLAALAVALPIALHLWSRKPSKRVLFGALRWVPPEAEQQAATVELNEPWLLVVRCLLLVLLALLLAKPVMDVFTSHDKMQKGWVLVAPSLLQQPDAGLLRMLEDLRQAGHEVRALQQGFKELDIAAKSIEVNVKTTDNYWQLAKEALMQLPTDAPLWVYADAAAMHYSGARPALPARVSWQTLPVARKEFFIVNAVSMKDSVHLLVGAADSSSVRYEKRVLSNTMLQTGVQLASWGRFMLASVNGRMSLVQQQESGLDTFAIAEASPKRILVAHSPPRKQDGYYCRAALEAAAQFMGAQVVVQEKLTTATLPDSTTDVLVWLAEGPLPATVQQWVRSGGRVVRDAAQNAVSLPGYYRYNGEGFVATVQDTVLQGARVLGSTQVVLSIDTLGKGQVIQWHTRLTPVHNNLVASPQFAAWWVDQLVGWAATPRTHRYDLRTVPAALAMPVLQAGGAGANTIPANASVTELLLWFLVLGIFLLERTMRKRQKGVARG